MSAPRILFCGDVIGRLDQLYKRVAFVNKSGGPFDALLCAGQFFPDEDENAQQVKEYIDGLKEIPLPTYFVGNYGAQAAQLLASASSKAKNLGLIAEPISICANLYWLKGSGVFSVNGLRIAYLGGKFDPECYEDAKRASEMGAFHRDDVDALRALADDPQINDVLLTNEWPSGVLTGSTAQDLPEVSGNTIVAELAAELKPRYHIVGSEGFFCARVPYSNQGVTHVTRFVALGVVGNDKKQKYLHALSPTPAVNLAPEELSVAPPNTTPSPYQDIQSTENPVSRKRLMPETAPQADSEGQYWRFGTSTDGKKQKRIEGACFDFISKGSCPRGEKCKFKHTLENGTPFPRKSCFDFITKGSCERGSECKFHHVTEDSMQSETPPNGTCFQFLKKGSCDKGDSCRFSHTMEKRGHTPGPCWFCLSSPEVETHLVVSVGDHCYCALAKGSLLEDHVLIIPIEHVPATISVSREAKKELQDYKDSLRKLYESQGKAMLVFERYINLRAGTHAHLQVLPIPLSLASRASEAFQAAAKDLGFTFVVFPSGNQSFELKRLLDGVNYFFVELPDGTVLAHPCASDERMPLQFGREVIAKLLDIPEKADWKACKLTKDRETELVETFKQQFEAYDPMRV